VDLETLKREYRAAVRILSREKQMRQRVLRGRTQEMLERVGEIDRMLDILARWKDELKRHADAPAQLSWSDLGEDAPAVDHHFSAENQPGEESDHD